MAVGRSSRPSRTRISAPSSAASRLASGESTAGSVRDWLNVHDFGAQGDGGTDDTAAIQAALATAPMGGIVYLPAGAYRTSAPLTIPPAVTLMGTHTNLMTVPGLTDPPCYIKPLPSFAGAALILLLDAAAGGYSTISAEHRILNVMIDGQDLPALPPVDGLSAKGNIQNVGLRDFTVRQCTGNGIYCGENEGINPYSWRLHRVMLDNNCGHGLSVQVMTDLTMGDCRAIGNWASGFSIVNAANSLASMCRAEWNGNHGIHITGDWADGTGAGGILLSGRSTDRNGWHGVCVDAAGTPPIQISGLHTRRDGRNGGLGIAAATTPVLVSNMTCYPGTDDNGSQTSSPQYELAVTGAATLVQVDDAYLHAATQGLYSTSTGTLVIGAGVTEATGPTDAPVRTPPVATSSKGLVITAPAGAATYVIWRAPKACTVTAVRGYRVGGSGASINAQKNVADLLATDLPLSTPATWLSGPSVQNATFNAGDTLSVAVRSVTGSPAAVTVQVDVQGV
ncbi:right-handed parallel beta-helix repeat-containing protein [Streptomyces sp. 35G-GA-8]|uniref:right-handed parallel beta-helix repeat-containing protein n=1 Tax=Streptomyces sp. 35G-GA-8 TaxID=2939434 RepID=UPI00201EB03A|nr:right-handed parallel beta-helix repeat-containing protein [Streptomyces sp. 35G-GA-8]MCL7382132.1 hypothetical protein [Streptomyces sp. 35G-GA-8]